MRDDHEEALRKHAEGLAEAKHKHARELAERTLLIQSLSTIKGSLEEALKTEKVEREAVTEELETMKVALGRQVEKTKELSKEMLETRARLEV